MTRQVILERLNAEAPGLRKKYGVKSLAAFGSRGAIMTSGELERLWEAHLAGEFQTKDVEATLETMVDDAVVDHIPVHSGGRGKDALRVFYRDVFIPSWPDDLEQTLDQPGRRRGKTSDEIRIELYLTTARRSGFLPGCAAHATRWSRSTSSSWWLCSAGRQDRL